MANNSKQIDPLQNLFIDIKKITEIIEIKDLKEANKYETADINAESEMWMNALSGNDTYTTYRRFWNVSMFQEVVSNVKLKDIKYWIENPYTVPLTFHDNLLKRGRECFLTNYEEKNEYYRTLNGLPPIETKESDFIYMSQSLQDKFHVNNIPIHLLSVQIQNSYMNTEEYKELLMNNPDKKYLNYLGSHKIDIYTARKAKDFEIIRYPENRSDINPNIMNIFGTIYSDYREYVMVTLYNEYLEGVYENYRTFMRLIILMFTILQISNKAVESINDKNFLDDSVLHIFLSMYDIPRTLLLTNEIRRNLVVNMLKLIREKGTDDIYYDLVDILGYQDIIVSKLMMMKGQQFDKDNNYSTNINDTDPYFIKVDLQDKDPYNTITSGNAPIYSYHDIVDNDPTWWDLPDTREILHNSNYTISDSKYIIVEIIIQQIKYLLESVYFSRLILDNKNATDSFLIEIPEIFGTEMVSIYDLMVFIIAATCMNNGMSGEILSNESRLLSTAGFNFDVDTNSLVEFINSTNYVDRERIIGFIDSINIDQKYDISRLFNDVIVPMREWLELKISNSYNRREYLEYESIYRALYTYDVNRNSFLTDFEMPIETIRKKYNLTEDEIISYQHFYPRTVSGEKVTLESYNESRYTTPFLSRNNEIDWWIHIIIETPYGEEDRGYVYFHDILNHKDLRELTNPDGTRVFMDYEDNDTGWELNEDAINKALYLLDHLDDHALNKACFQVDTPVQNSNKLFLEGEKLPVNIRSETYKSILKEKLMMDMEGLAVPPNTYKEYLYRKNRKLYNLLVGGDRFNLDKESWMNDVMKILLSIESELNIHLKYLEQSVSGQELFFKPLITLIKHFKSTLVDFAKTGLRYIFADKIDSGGNSNMFKLFDEVKFIVHFVTLANKGYESQFGLYDTEHKLKYNITIIDDLKNINGSFCIKDEMKFFKNGEPLDDYPWLSGDYRDRLITPNNGIIRINNFDIDFESWKDFIVSYTPVE